VCCLSGLAIATTNKEAIAQTLNSEKLRGSLLLPERQTYIDLLLRLLTDYTNGDLPQTQKNQETQIDIWVKLDISYFDLGEVQKSEEALQQQRISIGKASRLAGMPLIQFQHRLAQRQIPVHYSEAAFEEDLQTLRSAGRLT
jgi:Uncharacterised protein family (UPF0175)